MTVFLVRTLLLTCCGVVLPIGSPIPGAAQVASAAIVGSWHGTSSCADTVAFSACHDEEVVYDVRAVGTSGDSVAVRADKAATRTAMPGHFTSAVSGCGPSFARSQHPRIRSHGMAHGKICYLEIPADRAEDSASFYSTIFGWTVRPRGDGNLAFDDTGCVGGTWVKASDRSPDEQTRVYIMVENIADTLRQIVAAGGRILTPRTDIGRSLGAFAAFADPVGNEFGLYEEPER